MQVFHKGQGIKTISHLFSVFLSQENSQMIAQTFAFWISFGFLLTEFPGYANKNPFPRTLCSKGKKLIKPEMKSSHKPELNTSSLCLHGTMEEEKKEKLFHKNFHFHQQPQRIRKTKILLCSFKMFAFLYEKVSKKTSIKIKE